MNWYDKSLVLIFLHIAAPQTSSTMKEDLVDEYYTVVPTETNQFIPQDGEDAQTILDSNKNETVIASILPYREKMRRFAINEQVKIRSTSKNEPWIRKNYFPQGRDHQPAFVDLCFALTQDESAVIGSYLHNFLDSKDKTWIIIGMVLSKDIQNMIKLYNENMPTSFKHQRIKKLKYPFKNMMRVWVRCNREQIEHGELNEANVIEDARTLSAEHDDGGWRENRNQLELILMKKSIKYAKAVLQEFDKFNFGTPIEDAIVESMALHKLDKHLANAYSSLARYIKNKYSYIAGILRQFSDGEDYWAAWIMCIAVLHPQEWPKVDEIFKNVQGHQSETLSQFIVRTNIYDKVMAEMMAAIVDPSFKPTTFTERPIHNGSGQSGPLPPVSPTSLAT